MRKKFIAGNWKMFKTQSEAINFANKFKAIISGENLANANVAICANYIVLKDLANIYKDTPVKIGAQNMHFEDEGAFTGEVSHKMLKEIGIALTIIGHSERREYFNETDETVNKKLKVCFANGIDPILCVGESLEIRESGDEKSFVKNQLVQGLSGIPETDIAKLTIAYEPIWAIGTGKTASDFQAEEMCKFIRETVAELYNAAIAEALIVQYGGSVKPENAKELFSMPNIDGGLIGGASLKEDAFFEIVKAGALQ